MKHLKLPVWLLLSAAAAAARAQDLTFADKSGNMTIRHFSSWSTRLTGPDTIHFKASGKALEGQWVNDGLTIKAQTIEGDAQRVSGKLILKKAVATGGVHAVADKGNDHLTTDSAQATIEADGAALRLALDGGVTIDTNNPVSGSSSHTTGARANVRFEPPVGLSRATLFGPVRSDMKRRGTQGVPVTLTARCGRLEIDRRTNPSTITLIDDVRIEGSDPVLAGDIRATRAVITMDENGQPIGIDAEGEPGVARVRERTGQGVGG